jgi:hypothetical protein
MIAIRASQVPRAMHVCAQHAGMRLTGCAAAASKAPARQVRRGGIRAGRADDQRSRRARLACAAQQPAGAFRHATHADIHRIAGEQPAEMPPAAPPLTGAASAAGRLAAIPPVSDATIGLLGCLCHGGGPSFSGDHPSTLGRGDRPTEASRARCFYCIAVAGAGVRTNVVRRRRALRMWWRGRPEALCAPTWDPCQACGSGRRESRTVVRGGDPVSSAARPRRDTSRRRDSFRTPGRDCRRRPTIPSRPCA